MSEQEPKTWRVRDIVRILNITRETTLKLLGTGQLRGFKVGRDWRVSDEALREFMVQTPKPPPDDTEEPTTADNPFADLDIDLEPGLCDRLPLLGLIESIRQQTIAPRPLEA